MNLNKTHILAGNLEPTWWCSLVRQSWSRNTLTETNNNKKKKESHNQILQMVTYSYVCECRGKVNKETHPRLCIRPMVTATEEKRWALCSTLYCNKPHQTLASLSDDDKFRVYIIYNILLMSLPLTTFLLFKWPICPHSLGLYRF